MCMPCDSSKVKKLCAVCHDAWIKNMLTGRSGNASLRTIDKRILITRSGAAKGHLSGKDICIVDSEGAVLAGNNAPSIEVSMHLAIYEALPMALAVLHTHPRHMLALSLCVEQEKFLDLPLFEASDKRARLGFAPALPPGSKALAHAVAAAASAHEAVWMQGHGLCCWGKTLDDVLALSEELEHLAAVQLLSLPHEGDALQIAKSCMTCPE